jgi:preprotein translocase subunit SecB
MAEENQAVAAASGAETVINAQFQIQKLYVKDISFELPNAPEIFQEQGQSDVKMSLAQRVEDLGENLMEVVLAEIAQAGIFLVAGFNEQMKHMVMNTMCPNTLFPYARRAISAMVSEGGFPPLVLQPVNFEQLYAKRMQDLAKQQNGAAGQSGETSALAPEFKV